MPHRRKLEILIVDDNIGDVLLTKETLVEASRANRVSTACDGIEALERMRRNGKFFGEAKPDLVLLEHEHAEKEWLRSARGNAR